MKISNGDRGSSPTVREGSDLRKINFEVADEPSLTVGLLPLTHKPGLSRGVNEATGRLTTTLNFIDLILDGK